MIVCRSRPQEDLEALKRVGPRRRRDDRGRGGLRGRDDRRARRRRRGGLRRHGAAPRRATRTTSPAASAFGQRRGGPRDPGRARAARGRPREGRRDRRARRLRRRRVRVDPVGHGRPADPAAAPRPTPRCARGMAARPAGAPHRDVGAAVEREVEARGFAVLRDLQGHGVGRAIHEPPRSRTGARRGDRAADRRARHDDRADHRRRAGARSSRRDDGWTVRTRDGARSAHAEHTIVITRGAPARARWPRPERRAGGAA